MRRTDTAPAAIREYADRADDERPLRGYALVMSTYAVAVTAAAVAARLTGRRLPERLSAADLALLSVGTHKVSRLLTKDAVTSPLRAPVTRFDEPAGAAEINESPRGSGIRHSLGELFTCPFCANVWIASGFAAGLVFAPRLTRFAMGVATGVAGADFLHLAYDGVKKAATG
ncbi:MAG: hypothetical protein QOI74_2913 [Micromonosporaceae bacterium]|jgi:hypothetical protein|nr:hypothetical protein [Micromonosporaceae bacterium]MDT5035396.1 hypothetical protein [Micromonosporaceae bacterium]